MLVPHRCCLPPIQGRNLAINNNCCSFSGNVAFYGYCHAPCTCAFYHAVKQKLGMYDKPDFRLFDIGLQFCLLFCLLFLGLSCLLTFSSGLYFFLTLLRGVFLISFLLCFFSWVPSFFFMLLFGVFPFFSYFFHGSFLSFLLYFRKGWA